MTAAVAGLVGGRGVESSGSCRVRSLPASTFTPSKVSTPFAVGSASVLPSGALAGDRRWAFVDGKDRFVNGKQFPAIHRVRTQIDPDASTAVFDDLHFRLAGDATPLEDWVSERLATPVRLRENPTAGFPDDTDAPGPTLIATATLEAVAGVVRPDARAGTGPLPRQHRDRRRAGVLGGRVLRRHLPYRRRRGRRGARRSR